MIDPFCMAKHKWCKRMISNRFRKSTLHPLMIKMYFIFCKSSASSLPSLNATNKSLYTFTDSKIFRIDKTYNKKIIKSKKDDIWRIIFTDDKTKCMFVEKLSQCFLDHFHKCCLLSLLYLDEKRKRYVYQSFPKK